MMERLVSVAAVVLLTGVLVPACTVPEIPPPVSTAPAGPAVITTSLQGARAASQIAQSRELLFTSTQLFKNLGDFALSRMDPALPNQNTDITCADGGAFQYSGTYTSGTGAYNLTLTFNGCRDKGNQYVGSYTVSGTPASFTVTLGGSSTFNIFNFNTAYTVLLAYLKASSRFTMAGTGTSTDAVYTITSTGTITTFDYFLLDTYTMTFSALRADYELITDSITQDQTTIVVATGVFSETWAGGLDRLSMNLTSFRVDKVKLFSGTYYADDTSVTGRISFSFVPSSFGFGGLFDVVTTTPIHHVYAPSLHTTQGTFDINSAAIAQYNAGGDVDVTAAPDAPLNYANEYNMMKLADFSAMEQDKPPLLGPVSSSPVTGSTLAVTLTWTGPAPSYASSSDMDLHVKYYNITTPTASTAETWHIDWHQGKSCTDPVGLSFGDAFDITADGRCDVGLDFDDVNGFGPEHITALTIPTGYYVVSVDSYGLHGDASATLYLSLHIGDNIFGPYTNTLSTSDGEGTDSASWFRVADVRVNADGTVDVLAPDLTLNPWH